MLISVKAVRDCDRAVLAEAVFEGNDEHMARRAVADLVHRLYGFGDMLDLPHFTFVFEKADDPPRP
jgi:hypothetical protein